MRPCWAIMESSWRINCFAQAFKTTIRLPNIHFAALLKAHRPEKAPKSINFPLVFNGFWHPAFLPCIMPTEALPSPTLASRCPLGPPKKGQGGPKIAQDEPRQARKGPTNNECIPQENHWSPSWAYLWAHEPKLLSASLQASS